MKNKQNPSTKQFQRYGIRKFSQGVASVMIASGMFFLGSGAVSADEVVANTPNTDSTTQAADTTDTTDKEEVKTEAAAEVAPTLDTKALVELVSQVQQNFDKKTYDASTEAGKELGVKLEAAKRTLEDTNATQLEIDNTVKSLEDAVKAVEEELNKKIASEAVEKVAEADKEAATTEAAPAEAATTSTVDKTTLNNLLTEAPLVTTEVDKYAATLTDEAAKKTLTDAVTAVNAQVEVTTALVKNDKATAEEVATAENNLRNAVKAAADAAVAAGHGKEFSSKLDNTEYAVGNPSVIDAGDRISNSGTVTDSSHAMSNNTLIVDGTAVANPTGQATAASGATTLAEAVKLNYTGVNFNASTPISEAPGLILYGQNYGNDANGANGRDDYPVSKDEFDKINAEKELWGRGTNAATTASGWSTNTKTTGSGSTYEYLATEIYGYAYEQGEEVAITNFSKRFRLSEEATNAGWEILGVVPTNLPNGLSYDSATDTISGKISSSLENGVYDNRTNIYVTNGTTTVRYFLANYAVGWIGWKDTTAPTTVTTDDIANAGSALNTNIHFNDNAAPATNTASGTNSKTVTTRADGSITVEAPAWRSVAETSVLGTDQINGVSYSTTTGNLTGTASTAGIYTVTAQVKDYADNPNNEWTQSGQESHESFTITVRPGVTIGNVVAGATEVPITVSDGATQITVTLPDGTTVEAAKDSSGNWLVTGGTSSTATKGTNIGSGTSIKTPVNASSTTVGVDNISAVVAAENVSATLLTNTITLTTAQGETVVASFNKESGRWIINSVNGATVTTVDEAEKADDIAEQWVLVKNGNKGRISYRVENTDDTYSVRNLEIVSDLAATNNRGSSTGQNSYRVFEFTQTFDANGNVTAASSARSDAQTVNTAVVVTYNAATNTWTASDGSTVTATPNVTRYSTTDAASDTWGHGEDGKDYTAIRSASEMKTEKDGAGQTVPVYRDTESWTITTSSGVSGVVNRVSNKARDYASVTNTLPTAKGTDYSTDLNSTVNLLDPTKVTTADAEDTTPIVTKVTVTAPDGTVTTFEPTAELAVLNNAKAAVSTAQDAYKQAASDLKEAVDARIAADAAATAKNTELATAETTLDAAISEYKIAKAMVDEGGLTGDALTAAQARLTAAETAQTAAQNTVNTLTTELTTLHNNVATAQATVNEKLATVNTTRAALEEKEDELTSAKNSVKAAVTNALNGSDAFKLDQVGKYKVSLSVMDNASNQVLSDATATGTTEGNDTNSGTVTISDVTADYAITVNSPEIVGTPKTSTDIQGATQTGQPTFTFDDTDKSEINQGTKAYTLASTEAKDADGNVVGTYSVDATTGVVTFVPNKDFTGTPTPAEVTLTVTFGTGDDAVTKSATATYTPTVVPVTPVAAPSETTGAQGATQTSPITYNADNNNDNSDTTLNFAKGSTKVNGETKSVELDKKSVKLMDGNTPVDTLTVANEGTYSLVKDSDGNVTGIQFKPLATFTGDATPVSVRISDVNGTPATTTYTPHVTAVDFTVDKAETSGNRGVNQSGAKITPTKPTVAEGVTLSNPTFTFDNGQTTKTVEGVGTYNIDAEGNVSFSPVASYTGGTPAAEKVTVSYTLTATDGTKQVLSKDTTYQVTVKEITSQGNEVTTSNIQGKTQHSTDDSKSLTYMISDDSHITDRKYAFDNGQTTKTVVGVGTYTVDDKGQVTFTPEARFTGTPDVVEVTETATLTADDKSTAEIKTVSKYTPTVTPVEVTTVDKTSINVQGQPQEATPEFNVDTDTANKVSVTDRKLVNPADGKSVTSYEVENVGKYEIDANGKVTFTPTATFTGTAPAATVVATVTIENEKGDTTTVPATATYTPTVVPAAPTASESSTTGIQGAVQKSEIVLDNKDENVNTVNFNKGTTTVDGKDTSVDLAPNSVTLLDAQGNPAASVTVEGQGTYTIVEEGGKKFVQFTPVASYTGDVTPVTVRIADTNGTTVTTTYTPKIVGVTPVADASKTTGKQGQPQTSTIVYDAENNSDGNITTLNLAGGSATINGTKQIAALDHKSVTLLDASGNAVDTVTVEGQGTYTLVKDAEGNVTGVTFTPEASFTGEATPVNVRVTDVNGNSAQTTYTPTVVANGTVVVNYVDEDGNVIKTPVTKTDLADGSEYDTTPNRDTKITAEDGTVYYYKKLDDNSAAAKGKVDGGNTTEVTYVYEKAGSVTVNYVDKNGNPIKSPVTDEDNVKPGTKYDTTDNKPTTITTAEGKTYRLVPNATKGNETGTVVSGENTQVTYTYEEVYGNVTVEYYDQDGNKIAPDTKAYINASTGMDYATAPIETITAEDGTVYYYKEVKSDSAPESGKVTEGNTAVKYVYEKAGSVTVNYVDKNGNPIKAPVTDEDNVKPGKKYDTTDNKPTTITTEEGKTYRLVPNATKGNETGTVVSGENTQVTYTYEEVYGNVTVEYYDKDGNKIAPDTKAYINASTGMDYATAPIETITAEDGTVYYYKEVKSDSAPESGKVSEGDTLVKYVYEKAGSVTVNYVDKNGNPIKSPVTDEDNVKPGKKYDTTDNKPTTITTEDGKTYRLVPNETKGNETGTVVSGENTQVTYTYEEVTPEVKRGDVEVRYITHDKDGNVVALLQPETVVNAEEVGKGYNVENKRLETLTVDGKKYKLVEVIGNENGTIVEGTTSVTYVYVEDVEPTTNVTTSYVDENGTPIPGYPTVPGEQPKKDIPGYEFVRTDTDSKGNITHVYKKVTTPTPTPTEGKTTSYVDENGTPIPGYPTEKGEQPKKDIPGYEFVETKTDENGNITHVYKKVTTPTPTEDKTTSYVDENGTPIPGYPTEEGEQPKKDIPGYEFVETRKDDKGNITHVYKKVTTPTPTPTEDKTTSYVDEDGKEIPGYPTVPGEQPKKDIPGYEFVETRKDDKGNTIHVYKKVTDNPVNPDNKPDVKPDTKPEVPTTPETPAQPTTPAKQAELPNTGVADNTGIFGAAAAAILSGLGIAIPGKKKKDDQ